MKNSSTLIGALFIGLLVFLGVAFLVSNSSTQGENENTAEVQKEKVFFPKGVLFELEDYNGTIFRPRDFKEDILVVNAWASWCPFCVNELPDFAELQNRFPEGVAVIAINRAEPLSTAKSFSDSLNLNDSITFLMDPNDLFYKSIGGFSMPETLFTNRKGEVLLHKRGPMNVDEMISIVEPLLTQ